MILTIHPPERKFLVTTVIDALVLGLSLAALIYFVAEGYRIRSAWKENTWRMNVGNSCKDCWR